MLFDKEFLQDLDAGDYVSFKPAGSSRWLNDFDAVFEHEGHYYLTQFSVGKSETQEYPKYSDHPAQIECPEVWPVQRVVTTTEYVTRKPD